MDIFELLKNDKFFNPLTGKNRRIYFECISLLIEKSKEIPVLYDSDARNAVTIYLRNSQYQFIDEMNEDSQEIKTPDRNASDIMMYLRECGWITPREIGRNGENIANIPTNCRRIIDFLRKMSEQRNEGALSNHIISMYEIMKSSFDADSVRAERPYTNILKPMVDHEVELKNELLDLKENIVSIMRLVMELNDANSFGKFLMKDELLEQFFNDYFFIKNNGLIISQIAYITEKLREIAGSRLKRKMIAECAAKFQINEEAASERINNHFTQLMYFLTVEYVENMELIDMRINTYYNLANTRIMLVINNGVNMESVMDSFLNKMKELTEKGKSDALEKVSDCLLISAQKYIGQKSFEKRKQRDTDTSSIGLNLDPMSEAEKEELTKKMLSGSKNRFSMELVSQFLQEKVKPGMEMELVNQRIPNKEEAIAFASSIMYSENEDFPFEVELQTDFVTTKIAKLTNIKIRRK